MYSGASAIAGRVSEPRNFASTEPVHHVHARSSSLNLQKTSEPAETTAREVDKKTIQNRAEHVRLTVEQREALQQA